MDRAQWPALKARFAELFRTRTSAAVGRVLRRPRGVLRADPVDVAGARPSAQRRARHVRRRRRRAAARARAPLQPHAVRGARPAVAAGADTDTALAEWGFTAADVAALKSAGAIA